jgi:hypothetical protein
MFDLEQSIVEWRQQMLAVGIKTPVPLEELEIHLREDIARQMQSGLSAQQAFGIAVKKIGHAPELKREFKKVSAPMEMQKIIELAGVLLVAVALFCPLFMFLPCLQARELSLMTKMLALAVYAIPGSVQLRHELAMANSKLGLWLLGLVLLGWSFSLFQRIIQPKVLKGEFEKVEMTPVKQTMKIGTGIVVLLIGIALMMPAAAQARHEGMVEFDGLCYAVFGIALILPGAVVAFRPYKRRRA